MELTRIRQDLSESQALNHEGDFDAVVDDFLSRHRHGANPTVQEYRERYPQFAAKIEHYFPALLVMEEFGAVPLIENHRSNRSAIPRQFGDFSIVREIGRGGMGIVYEAVQESLGRKVALKILPEHSRMKGTALARFQREASAAAQLHHTNIVPVFGFGEWHGTPYYAMQYIEGQSLDHVIAELNQLDSNRGVESKLSGDAAYHSATLSLVGIPGAETIQAIQSAPTQVESLSKSPRLDTAYFRNVASLGMQAATALAYAHAHGILHRDIKPSNLLLDGRGTLWITDFGLAKEVGADGGTRTGELVGTLRYMAPERFRGEATPQSHIYALGTTLYELLALQPAFMEKEQPKLIVNILSASPIHLRQINPHIPADLETIIEKASAPDPKDRYGSATALAEDLRLLLTDRPILSRKSSKTEKLLRWCRRNRSLAAMIVLTLLSLLIVTIGSAIAALVFQNQLQLVKKSHREQQQHLFEATLEKARTLVASRRVGQHYEALKAIRQALTIDLETPVSPEAQLTLRNLALTSLVLPDVEHIDQPHPLPPEVNQLACNHNLEWYLAIDQHGRLSRHRTTDGALLDAFLVSGPVQDVTLSPDDRLALIHQVDQHGAATLSVLDIRKPHVPALLMEAAKPLHGLPISEDGCHCLVTNNDHHLELRSTVSGKPVKRLSTEATDGSCASPQPRTGHWAVLSSDGAFLRLIDATNDRTLLEWNTKSAGPVGGLTWNCSGSMLVSEIDRWVQVWSVTDSETRLISTLEKQQNESVYPRFVPGSDLLVWTCWDGTCQLWDPVAARSLLRFPGTLVGMHHDGCHLLLRDPDAQLGLWRLTTGTMCRTLHHGLAGNSSSKSTGWVRNADFSPDGKVLATTGVDVRFWDVAQGIEIESLKLGKCCGVFQPGKWRYITSSSHGIQSWPLESNTSNQQLSLRIAAPIKLGEGNSDSEAFPQWSPDGRYLCWVEGEQAVLWDQSTASPTRRFGPVSHLRYVGLTPHAGLIVLAPHRGESSLEVWDRAFSRVVFQHPCKSMGCPCFSKDGRSLYLETIEGNSRQLHVWDTTTWREDVSLEPHPKTAGIAFSADSRMLARGVAPGQIKLFDLSKKTTLALLTTPYETHHYSMTFSPQDDQLAVANMDHSFQLWNIRALRNELAKLGLDW